MPPCIKAIVFVNCQTKLGCLSRHSGMSAAFVRFDTGCRPAYRKYGKYIPITLISLVYYSQ